MKIFLVDREFHMLAVHVYVRVVFVDFVIQLLTLLDRRTRFSVCMNSVQRYKKEKSRQARCNFRWRRLEMFFGKLTNILFYRVSRANSEESAGDRDCNCEFTVFPKWMFQVQGVLAMINFAANNEFAPRRKCFAVVTIIAHWHNYSQRTHFCAGCYKNDCPDYN